MEQIDKKEQEKFEEENQIEFDKVDKSKFKVVGEKPQQNERILSKPYSYWRSVGSLLLKSKTFIVAAILLVVIILLMFIVPAGKDITTSYQDGPGLANSHHPFGFGLMGEDYWVEIWAGMRTTVLFALLIMVIEIIIGVVVGALWGYYRKSDLLWINLTNLLQVIPQLIMILFIIFLLKPGYWPVVLGVSIQSWITLAANIRVQVMLVKSDDYNTASETLGTKSTTIIRRNILPKILPVIVQQGTFAVPIAVSVDATVSFLNVGFIDPNSRTNTSLGTILNQVMSGSDWQQYPHLIIIPIILVSAISVIFFVIGKSIADSLDPKNHR